MLKFKNKIIVASLTLLMLVGCSNTNTTQKVSPEGTQRLYGVDTSKSLVFEYLLTAKK